MRTYFRTFIAALIVGADVALLVVFLNMTGWLEASGPPGPMPTAWPTATPVRVIPPTPTPRMVTTHVVKSGEVLAEIAKRYGLSVQDIMEANGIRDPNVLRAGQPLTIPVPPAR